MFENIISIDELRKAYRAAAMANHPDHGGNEETMKRINEDYDKRFEELKRQHNERAASDVTGKTRPINETPEKYRAVIEKLIRIPDIMIELCGSWIWISGETRAHKDEIKAAGCWWAKQKGMWYWRAPEDAHRGKSSKSMDDIRQKYGSERITSTGHSANLIHA